MCARQRGLTLNLSAEKMPSGQGAKMDIKRGNHYIWAHYLRGWSHNQRDVFHRTKKGNIQAVSTKGLGREYGFYKLTPLDNVDVKFLERWISKCDPGIKNFHYGFLRRMIVYSCLLAVLDPVKDKEKRDDITFNTIEELHTTIENDVRPTLDALRNGNFLALEEENALNNLISYMGHQFSRTKVFRNIIDSSARSGNQAINELMIKNNWFLAILIGVNMGYSTAMCYETKNVVWLINNTDTRFITSDNPVINVHPEVLNRKPNGIPPSHIDLYFPISPTLGYMVNDSDYWGKGKVEATNEMVVALNRQMLIRCDETVYGDSMEIIKQTKLPKA